MKKEKEKMVARYSVKPMFEMLTLQLLTSTTRSMFPFPIGPLDNSVLKPSMVLVSIKPTSRNASPQYR